MLEFEVFWLLLHKLWIKNDANQDSVAIKYQLQASLQANILVAITDIRLLTGGGFPRCISNVSSVVF